MRKFSTNLIILSFILISSFKVNLYAQEFTFQLTSDSLITGVPGQELIIYATITNNNSSSITVDLIRTENNLATGWTSSLCIDVCFPPTTDSVRFNLAANQSEAFTFHFYTSTTKDSSHAKVVFKNVYNASNMHQQNLYGKTDSIYLSTNNLQSKGNKISLYPSPVILNKPVFFHISEKAYPASTAYEMIIYDVLGNEVKRIVDLNRGYNNFILNNLKTGLYFYHLLQNKKVIKSGKFLINQK